MNDPTLQQHRPHICGSCKCPKAPHRWSGNYREQCNCSGPTTSFPASDDSLRFIARDPEPEPAGAPPLAEALNSVESMRLACGTTPVELVGERVVDSRTELLEAMKLADRHGEGDLHRRVAELMSDMDDVLAIVAERSAR